MATPTTTTKRTFSTTPQEWSARLAAAQVSKHDLNALVANYLFTEGYLDAATHFAREASLSDTATRYADSSKKRDEAASPASLDLESIRIRRDIRSCVQRGHIQSALDKVVELDPEILERNPSLHFSLLQQHLIELIRQGQIPQALEFAQTELAPRGEEHPKFLEELEKTMALLAFEMPSFTTPAAASGTEGSFLAAPVSIPTTTTGRKSKKPSVPSSSTPAENSLLPPMPGSLVSLLDPNHRLETSLLLNSSILTSQGRDPEPKLPKLFGVLNWGEGVLKEKGGEWDKWELRDELLSMQSQGKQDESSHKSEGDAMMF